MSWAESALIKGAVMSLPSGLNCNNRNQLVRKAAFVCNICTCCRVIEKQHNCPSGVHPKDSRGCIGYPLQLGLCPLGQCPKCAPQP